jgi:hypothetical protein
MIRERVREESGLRPGRRGRGSPEEIFDAGGHRGRIAAGGSLEEV